MMQFLRPAMKRKDSSEKQRASPPRLPSFQEPIAAIITIDPTLPTQLAAPTCAAVSSIVSNACNGISHATLRETTLALQARTYFAACKQLYSIMTPFEKENLGPLAQIACEHATLPQNLAVALFSILSVDTMAGRVKIKQSALLFKRWLVQGLVLFPGCKYNGRQLNELIWKDHDSKQWLDEQLQPFIKGDNAFSLECRRIRQLSEVPDRNPAFEVLGIELAGVDISAQALLEAFYRCNMLYYDRYHMIVGTILKNVNF